MRARIPDTLQRLRPARPRRGDGPATPPDHRGRPPRPDRPAAPEARVRDAGGPEDHASYTCGCGLVFTASVTTSVACPHCGAEQAW